MAGHLLSLYPATHASRLKRLTSIIPFSAIRRYKHEGKSESGGAGEGAGIDKERAPSTAEQFKRVAEEKSRQGFSSQTVEKASDGAAEAAAADGGSEPQNVKEAFKEAPGKGDFHKTGNQR